MRKSRNIIRKRRISKRRSIYGGQSPDAVDDVRGCPNELEPKLKWKYGDYCYASCDATRDKTFATSWDDDHDQRTCEADTPSNRQRYNLLRRVPSTAYKAARVGRDAAIAAKDAAISAKNAAVNAYNVAAPYAVDAYNVAAPYAVAAKDRAVDAYNYVAPILFPPRAEDDDEEDDEDDYPVSPW